MTSFSACALSMCWLVSALGAGEDHYKCGFAIPPSDLGCLIGAKSYLDELDPKVRLPEPTELKTFATPGEYEPLAFVIYAARDLKAARVAVSDLTQGDLAIPADAIEVRTVVRRPRRITYQSPPEDHWVVSRFLLPFSPFDLPAGHFREIWLTARVPDDAKPGPYRGRIEVTPGNAPTRTIPLALEVLPFRLPRTAKK